jgi:hypothetical protein
MEVRLNSIPGYDQPYNVLGAVFEHAFLNTRTAPFKSTTSPSSFENSTQESDTDFPINHITDETESNFLPSHVLFDGSLPFEASCDQSLLAHVDYSKLSNVNNHDLDSISSLAEQTASNDGGLFPQTSKSSRPRIITVENPVHSSSMSEMLDALPKNIPHLEDVIKACKEYPTLSLAGRARKIDMSHSTFLRLYKEYKLHTIFDSHTKNRKLKTEKQADIIREIISKAFPNHVIDSFSRFKEYSITTEIVKMVLVSQDISEQAKAIFKVCAEHPEFTVTKKANTINMPHSTFSKRYISLKFDTLFDTYRDMRKSENVESLEKQVDIIRDVISTTFPNLVIDSFKKFKHYSITSEIVQKIRASQDIAEEAKAIFQVCAEHPERTIAEKAREVGISRPIFTKRYRELKFDTLFDPYKKVQKSEKMKYIEKQTEILRDLVSKAASTYDLPYNDLGGGFELASLNNMSVSFANNTSPGSFEDSTQQDDADFPINPITEETESNFLPSHDLFDELTPFKAIFDQSPLAHVDYPKLSNLDSSEVDSISPLAEQYAGNTEGPFSQTSKYSESRIITIESPVTPSSINKTENALPPHILRLNAIIDICKTYPILSGTEKALKIGMPYSTFNKIYKKYRLNTIFKSPAKIRKLNAEKQADIIRDVISKAFPNHVIDSFNRIEDPSITAELVKIVLDSPDIEKIAKAIFQVCAEYPTFTTRQKAQLINVPPSTFSKKYSALKFDTLFDSNKKIEIL